MAAAPKLFIQNNWEHGINEVVPYDNMRDTELRECENLSVFNRGGLEMRDGTSKLNNTSYAAEVEQKIEWVLSDGQVKNLIVKGNTLYVVNEFTYKSEDGSVDIVANNTVSNTLGSLGTPHYTTASGVVGIVIGKIVRNYPISTGAFPGVENHLYKAIINIPACALISENFGDEAQWEDVTDSLPGTIGNLYQAAGNYAVCNLAIENFGDTTRWTDVSGELTSKKTGLVSNRIAYHVWKDGLYFIDTDGYYALGDFDFYSNDGTEVIAANHLVKNVTNGAITETYKVEDYTPIAEVTDVLITTAAVAAGNLTIAVAGAGAVVVAVAAGDSAATVSGKIRATAFAGWVLTGTDNRAVFTYGTAGAIAAATFNAAATEVMAAVSTTTKGATPTQAIVIGDVVLNTPGSSGGGTANHYYKAVKANATCVPTTENYSTGANWLDLGVAGTKYTATGTENIIIGDIVYNYPASSGGGVSKAYYRALKVQAATNLATADYTDATNWAPVGKEGHFYKALAAHGNTNLSEANYGVAAAWEDVTDCTGMFANIVRVVVPYTDETNDLAPIRRCTMIVLHPPSLRFFASGDYKDRSAVYFSEYDNPFYFKATNKLYPTTADGPVTGLLPLVNDMLVSYKVSWRYFSGVDIRTDAEWKKLPIQVGAVNPQAIAATPESFMFVSEDGIYLVHASITNDDFVIMSSKTQVNNLADGRLENTIKAMVHKDTIRLAYHDNTVYLAYGDNKFNTRNNKILVMDWDSKAFVRFTGLQVNDFSSQANGILSFASKNYVLQLDPDSLHDINVDTGASKVIAKRAVMKPYNLGGAGETFTLKFLHRLFISAQQGLTALEEFCDIKVYSDYEETEYLDTLNFAESLVWGRTYGKFWGYSELSAQSVVINQLGLRHQVVIEDDTLDNDLYIYSLGFLVEFTEPTKSLVHEKTLITENFYPMG